MCVLVAEWAIVWEQLEQFEQVRTSQQQALMEALLALSEAALFELSGATLEALSEALEAHPSLKAPRLLRKVQKVRMASSVKV